MKKDGNTKQYEKQATLGPKSLHLEILIALYSQTPTIFLAALCQGKTLVTTHMSIKRDHFTYRGRCLGSKSGVREKDQQVHPV